jgi:hypothetical protein
MWNLDWEIQIWKLIIITFVKIALSKDQFD